MKYLFSILLAIASLTAQADELCKPHSNLGSPAADQILCRDGYEVGYSYKAKEPAWVQYFITRKSLSLYRKRTNDFRPDLEIPKRYRSELGDYRHSGYDRGHLFPARDGDFSHRGLSQTFLLSNMTPQVGRGFNRGIWAFSEKAIRHCTNRFGRLLVISGTVFYHNKPIETIGRNHVWVPHAFYKVIFGEVNNKPKAFAILLPNKPLPNNQLSRHVTSVANIEKLTGLTFFSDLSKSVQSRIKRNTNYFCRLN